MQYKRPGRAEIEENTVVSNARAVIVSVLCGRFIPSEKTIVNFVLVKSSVIGL